MNLSLLSDIKIQSCIRTITKVEISSHDKTSVLSRWYESPVTIVGEYNKL
ncbi:hypothetical protein JJE65_01905 [Alloprevotella tannerae]|nr:hypothetical protein [Alloprevotella tannerae]MCG2648166.1 hypothetical protein [Alloprevotella tannerae]